MSEDLRDRISKLEARQDMFEKWVGQIRIDISEIRKTMETLIDKVARIEERINHLSERINHIEKSLSERIDRIELEIKDLRSRLWWIIGILIGMWITIILTILFK